MKRLIVGIGVICAAAIACAQQGNCVRLGTPLVPPGFATSAETDPGDQADAVLDVALPKVYYDAGEPVTLDVHLRTRHGGALDGDVTVDDLHVSYGALDPGRSGKHGQKSRPQGHGQHTVSLDNAPGEHNIVITANVRDAGGHSVRRARGAGYVVATGAVQFLDVGNVQPGGGGDMLVVPLKVRAVQDGVFTISATLASRQTAVAEVTRSVPIERPGITTVDLYFDRSAIVEPGPYRLVNVMAHGGVAGPEALAAAPASVGQAFAATHADHEPAQLVNEEGAAVGAYTGQAPPAPPPAPVRIDAVPPLVEGPPPPAYSNGTPYYGQQP